MTQDPPPVIAKKKLIEVALPLDAINKESKREKSIRHGHPSTLHLWWARRPLAAARAVIFSQMVDDPSANPDLFPTERAQERERKRLFGIIEELVRWENTTNEAVLERAREEIWQSWRRACAENADHPRAKNLFDRHVLPAFHDPFAGGGSLPVEAQRLGLEAHASDLNPVAVLINKAMIEIPPKFAGRPPVNPEARSENRLMNEAWRGSQGLADDVRYYGQWMRNQAETRIGHLYPEVPVTEEMAEDRPDLEGYVGRNLTVIAWLWVRTVKSPNPAFADVEVPLASTFVLSKKKGREAYVEPVIEGSHYRFATRAGMPPESAQNGTKVGRASFACLVSGTPISPDYIKSEGQAGRMGARLLAIVAEGDRERVYLSPTAEAEGVGRLARPEWQAQIEISGSGQYIGVRPYGMETFGHLFTDRQLVALGTLSHLVGEAQECVRRDAEAAGLEDDGVPLRDGGTGATAYADAAATYLAFAVDRTADSSCTVARWQSAGDKVAGAFARQAIPIVWDFAEANVFSSSTQNWMAQVEWVRKAIGTLPAREAGEAFQSDAASGTSKHSGTEIQAYVVSTDPPYYGNVPYADLSDFFYVWMRRSLRGTFPDLFSTITVPKDEELVAAPHRQGSTHAAQEFFLGGMRSALSLLHEQSSSLFPVTIYYAFKQSEASEEGRGPTGWET
ncbi:MAG: DUF1156 domain-containing protein, partial [Dehalococcoidia bacterium]|nr:DUF1156 domain-containing protein [Dehalococcoidia bacterium]